ncbi:hypothetical protein P692DRAFT_20898043 [Suillus brevipes Sb2]|nr:hypothetical protein P692DRAFT_20898043 [Suillus brevipes Sb2]
MLKWLVALHDAFELYGRPKAYTWDPRDPVSLMFAYPVNPGRDLLFLDREVAESMDPRDDRTSAIHNRLLNILHSRMPELRATSAPPPLPPTGLGADPNRPQHQQPSQSAAQPRPQTQNGQPAYIPQLPAVNFDLRSPSTEPSTIPVVPAQPQAQDAQSIFSDALFFMQQLDEKPKNPPQRIPNTISEAS